MVGMGYPGRRSGPGTARRQRKPAETAAGHHHLVQPLGAFLLPVVSPQQHAHVFRLAAARRPAGRRRLASGSQGSRARSGRFCADPGRAGPRALEKGGAAPVRRGMAGGTNAHGQTARKGRGRLEQPHGHETHHSSLERRRPHRAQGPLAETGRHPLLGGPTDRGGPGRGRTVRLRRLGARPCGRSNRKTHDPHDAGVRGEAGRPGRKRHVPGRGRPAFRRVRGTAEAARRTTCRMDAGHGRCAPTGQTGPPVAPDPRPRRLHSRATGQT